jgi:very-short-patch-repair endonuclease
LLLRWLQARFPDVQAQQPRFKRPSTNGTCKFDFSLPAERWIVELDGNISGGHFDDMPGNDCPVRDLEKEEWARGNGYQVIRVLQEDVWRDRNGWSAFLSTELANWATRRDAGQAPRKAITPQAPEYLGGVYKRLRSTVDTGPQLDGSGCTFCGTVVGGGDVCMNCGTLQGAVTE